ncbi:uncharacterized protein LOC111086782 [Limulus polyphemus]|uniref:Uncharacterized protein LOC111086782 n=1 Tax=Limulus polyphemus TaxID=6850 RepID=A0ABM1SSX5_LIMPO|nr:uncharacterized protein LOC111086782 [Limulus polyphemus]
MYQLIHSKKGQPRAAIILGVKEELLNTCDLVISIPASSAEVERGFSKMKIIKTNIRSCLAADRITDQLLVKFHLPLISDFDPITDIHLWKSGSLHTRPNAEKKVQESDEERDKRRIQEMDVGTSWNTDTDAF